MICYQCDEETNWLAPDSRCKNCTRLTPEEIRGEECIEDDGLEDEDELDFSTLRRVITKDSPDFHLCVNYSDCIPPFD